MSVSRRDFVKSAGATVATVAVASPLAAAVHTGHREELRIGIIGCGGRGSGAVGDALKADPNTKLVAMCDLFEDRLEKSHKNLVRSFGARIAVDDGHKFTGFDGYKGLIDSVDVVLMASTPHFRPRHLEYAVEKGKHIFCEKPVATDAPGLRKVWDLSRLAKQKGLSLVSGLCYRYHDPKVELQKRIHDGAVGDIVSLECTYNTGALWHRGNKPEWTQMEYQMRNWLYFGWLSGDHIAEQSIHSLDKILWAMQDEPPIAVTASGGRISRTDPKFGNVYDHFNTVYEFGNGIKLFHSCRQIAGAQSNVSDFVYGTKGTALIQGHKIKDRDGKTTWSHRGRTPSMYLREHQELFKSIRSGEPINNGDYMCKSTLMAMMGRLSAYTGKRITWDEALNSKESLAPKEYAFGDIDVAPVAQPGITRFI